jgi:putative sporulation protein YtaF
MLGLAVSFDGFGVGFAYGLRRVHIPPLSLLIICVSSALSVFVSMFAGGIVATLFNRQVGTFLGGLMLMGVGFVIVRQSLQSGSLSDVEAEQNTVCKEKKLSYFSDMLREPSRADFDNSGVITGKEAVALGVALAMDAFGAGFGAAMMGFSPLATALAVGVIKLILVTAGLHLGKRYSQNVSGERAAVFAGLVLMLLGITHLIT